MSYLTIEITGSHYLFSILRGRLKDSPINYTRIFFSPPARISCEVYIVLAPLFKVYLFNIIKNMREQLSNCCGAPSWGETDICSECMEHAEFEEE